MKILSLLYQWNHGFNLSRVLANRSENSVAITLSKMKAVIIVIEEKTILIPE